MLLVNRIPNLISADVKALEIRTALASAWRNKQGSTLTQTRNGFTLHLDEEPTLILGRSGEVVGVDAWVRLFDAQGEEVKLDPHRRFVNPPLHVVEQPGVYKKNTRGKRKLSSPRMLRRAPEAAYWEILWQSVMEVPNPKGWRTRGTVTTVFAGTADDTILSISESGSYTNARAGTGEIFTLNSDAVDGNNETLTLFTGDINSADETIIVGLSFIAFDTSSLPDTDSVSAAALSLFEANGTGVYDTINNGATTYRAYPYNWDASVTTDDWRTAAQENALTILATLASGSISTNAYNAFTESGTNFQSAISKTGTTYLMIGSSRLAAGTAPGTDTQQTFEYYSADNTGTTNDPKLVITHAADGATGTAAASLNNLTASATGVKIYTGTAVDTLPNLTAAATGVMHPRGTAAMALKKLTAVATGAQAITGTAVVILPNLTASAAGVMQPSGTAAPSLPNLIAAATGVKIYTGTSVISLPNLIASATSTSVSGESTGTSAVSLANLLASASGLQVYTGTSAPSLPNLIASATGVMQPSGTSVLNLPNLIATATGASAASGTSVVTLANLVAASSGLITFTGTSAASLPNLIAAATGTHPYIGASVLELPMLQVSASGASTQVGTATLVLPNLVTTATGELPTIGQAILTLPNLITTSTGAHPYTGTAVIILPNLTTSATGLQTHTGTSAASLPNLIAQATGAMQPKGTAAATLPNLEASAAGQKIYTGTAAMSLNNLTMTSSGGFSYTGISITTLPGLNCSIIAITRYRKGSPYAMRPGYRLISP